MAEPAPSARGGMSLTPQCLACTGWPWQSVVGVGRGVQANLFAAQSSRCRARAMFALVSMATGTSTGKTFLKLVEKPSAPTLYFLVKESSHTEQ